MTTTPTQKTVTDDDDDDAVPELDATSELVSEKTEAPVNVNRLAMCLLAKFMLFFMVVIGIAALYDGAGTYVAIGPSDNLVLISVYVNTAPRYLMLQAFLICYEFIRVVTNDVANPIIGWTIFNPDKKRVRGISRNKLQLFANLLWLLDRMMAVFEILVTLTQIDIALLRGVYSELVSIVTIRWLLNEKVFDEDIKSQKNTDFEAHANKLLF
jgi:hypothetical protein